MQSKVEVNERPNGALIVITLPDGRDYRLTLDEQKADLRINTGYGSLMIRPCVANEVIISSVE